MLDVQTLDWRPMETAPRTGERIRIRCVHGPRSWWVWAVWCDEAQVFVKDDDEEFALPLANGWLPE